MKQTGSIKTNIAALKRVFNGNCASLKTQYFGGGIDGTGIELAMPKILIICASNDDKIEDEALSSRFDVSVQ